MSKARRKRRKKSPDSRRRGVYVLPNLLTTASLFAGFYAIIAATKGQWQEAGAAVFVSLILDGLDGKIARLTPATSHFGMEYDSLADLVAFGVAPAVLVHQWALSAYDRLGSIAGFIYVVCGALRLARFNTRAGRDDPRFFVGLPIPAAAATVAAVVLVVEHLGLEVAAISELMLILLYILSFLMVSTLPYRSLKALDLRRLRSFNYLVAGVLIFSVIAYKPVHMAAIILAAYLGSGPVLAILKAKGLKPFAPEKRPEPEATGQS